MYRGSWIGPQTASPSYSYWLFVLLKAFVIGAAHGILAFLALEETVSLVDIGVPDSLRLSGPELSCFCG